MHDATFSTAYRLEFDSSNLDTLFMSAVSVYQRAGTAIPTGAQTDAHNHFRMHCSLFTLATSKL